MTDPEEKKRLLENEVQPSILAAPPLIAGERPHCLLQARQMEEQTRSADAQEEEPWDEDEELRKVGAMPHERRPFPTPSLPPTPTRFSTPPRTPTRCCFATCTV